MTRPIRASEAGLEPHYKIRVVLPGALLHLASKTEPVIAEDRTIEAEWIDDPDYGDTLGFIDWTKVTACTWRYSP